MNVQTYGQSTNPAIMFLHGAGVSSWMWTEQIEALCDSFYCVTVDLPGSGESYQTEWISFEHTADQLAQIISERIPGGEAHVVGLSLGGYTALFLLARHPERVQSMIVSGVTSQPFPNQWLYRPLLNVVAAISKWDPVIALNARMMHLPADIMPVYKRDSKRASSEMLKRVYDTLFEFTLPDPLYELSHRVLAVAGDKEAALVRDGLPAFNRLPNGTAYLAPDARHGWSSEHPALFTAMIRAWVTDRPLPAELLAHE
ncbi:MAG: alpha/beta hydrolase [Chloroflexi bacterium]|nr:alpha/beta hydrolase [Chloroflexota bacterium]